MVMGLPAHPLLVHFAIVLLLLAAGAQVLAVAVPRFRRWFDWGMPLLAVAGAVSGRVAQSYGEILMGTAGGSQALVEHQQWGAQAGLAGLALGGLSILHWVATSERGRSRWALALGGALAGMGRDRAGGGRRTRGGLDGRRRHPRRAQRRHVGLGRLTRAGQPLTRTPPPIRVG